MYSKYSKSANLLIIIGRFLVYTTMMYCKLDIWCIESRSKRNESQDYFSGASNTGSRLFLLISQRNLYEELQYLSQNLQPEVKAPVLTIAIQLPVSFGSPGWIIKEKIP